MAVVRVPPDRGPTVPDFLPILSRGKHKNPARGACFMEYTALLAGEPFTDAPACVDWELAAVLRHANDTLGDADRPRLVPLLGRAVGLAVRPPSDRATDGGDVTIAVYERDVAAYTRATVALHRRVSVLFMAAIGHEPTQGELRRYDGGREVDPLFWRLMHEPTVLRTPESYVARLVARLHLLHDCYERAMAELGLARTDRVRHEPAAVYAQVAAARG